MVSEDRQLCADAEIEARKGRAVAREQSYTAVGVSAVEGLKRGTFYFFCLRQARLVKLSPWHVPPARLSGAFVITS